jgi:hypothetical protein
MARIERIAALTALVTLGALQLGCGAAGRLGVPTRSTATAATAAPAPAVAVAPTWPTSTPVATDTAASGPGRRPGDAGALASPAAEVRLVVPDLIGKTPEEARAIVKAAGFTQEVELRESLQCEGEPRDPGRINCQEPEAGVRTNSYAMVHIKVFRAQDLVANQFASRFGDLRGLTLEEARQRLAQAGHDGAISVATKDQYDDGCGQNKACTWRLHGARTNHDEVTLWFNRKTAIALPAP